MDLEIIKIQRNTGIKTRGMFAEFFRYAPIHKSTIEERIIFKKNTYSINY